MTEKVQVEITLPSGYWKALQLLVDFNPDETIETYISRTLRQDFEAQFDDTTFLGEFIQPGIKQLIETE